MWASLDRLSGREHLRHPAASSQGGKGRVHFSSPCNWLEGTPGSALAAMVICATEGFPLNCKMKGGPLEKQAHAPRVVHPTGPLGLELRDDMHICAHEARLNGCGYCRLCWWAQLIGLGHASTDLH
eukprot:jgi/Mesen1/2506/ME000159S01629